VSTHVAAETLPLAILGIPNLSPARVAAAIA
jgi:hypothetical protein